MIPENEISYPDVKQSWGIAGISILAMLILSPITIVLDRLIDKEFAVLVYYLLAMGITFWFDHTNRKKNMQIATYDFDPASLKITVFASVAVIAIQIGVVSPIVNAIPIPEFMEQIFIEFGKRKGIFSAIAIVLAAPILEELVFRGIILDGLLKKYSPLKSILVSSMLFGLVHLNPWQFIAAFVIGILLAWTYYKTRKLTLCILIHFVNNLFAFMAIYFSDIESWLNKSLTEVYGGLFSFILIVLSSITTAIVCIYVLRSEFKKREFA